MPWFVPMNGLPREGNIRHRAPERKRQRHARLTRWVKKWMSASIPDVAWMAKRLILAVVESTGYCAIVLQL